MAMNILLVPFKDIDEIYNDRKMIHAEKCSSLYMLKAKKNR